mgnify:CR=1 FL=1
MPARKTRPPRRYRLLWMLPALSTSPAQPCCLVAPSRLGRAVRSRAFAWCVSVAVHLSILLAFWGVILREEVQARRVIIPEARLAAPADPHAPAASPHLKLAQQSATPTLERPRLADIPLPAVTLDQVASPPVASMLDATPSMTTTGAGTVGPASVFFGQTGNAYKVVYVVDVSASLWIYTDDIIREMRQSVRGLIPTQKFHIVLTRSRQIDELGSRRLVPAVNRYVQEAEAFLATIDRIPKPGKADPVEAMKRAFAVRPELIYFLSDGDYTDVESELERTLDQLNADRSVAITVIGFEPSPRSRALLERIARNHGGNFRSVETQR